MLLKRAYLENFISHARSELKFDYGINVIRGPNGAGKTSILDAISFGLFNIHSRGKKENLINNRADKAHIAIEFSEGGVNYIVEWIVDRKKPAAGILSRIQDGEKIIIAKGGERVIIPEIEKILSFDKDLFINSIYIKQGEIERLITETSAVRKEIITKLLGIEDLERAYQNMKEVINEYQAIVERLVGELKRKPEVEDQIQSLKSEIESLSLLLKSKKLKLKSIEEEIKILEEMLKELELKKERFIELSSQKAVLEATIENLDKTLRRKKDELKEAESAFTKVEILKEFVVKLPLIESYIDLFRKLNEKEKDIGQEYQKLKRVESLRSILVQNEGAYKSYLEKIALLKQKREERKSYEGAKEELAQVKKHLQDNVKKRNKKFEILLQRLNEYSQILGREVTQENIELILKAKKNELEILKAKLEKEAYSLREEIGGIKKEIEEIELKISKIADAKVCPVCGRDLTLEHKAILQEEFERTKQESQERINKLQEELKNVDLEKKECEKNLEKLAFISLDKITEIVEEVKELDIKINQDQFEIENLKKKAEALERIDFEIEEFEKEIKELEDSYQSYDAAKREIAIWPSKEEIEANLSKINEEIDVISKEIESLVMKLGYRPKNPEHELANLRSKKEDFDKNELLAKKRDTLRGEVQSLSKEFAIRNKEFEKVLEELTKLSYDENFHKERKREFEAKKQEIIEVKAEVVRLETEVKNKNDEKIRYENELKRLIEKEQEMTRVEKFIRILENIRFAFHKDGLQRLIRARSKPLLEKITRDFFEKFNLEFFDVQIDEDYNISLVGLLGTQTIEQISGGERVALAIALRLAIARVLSEKVETIIMDEPTVNLDEERQRELINILNFFFKEGSKIAPQIIVITHHQEIEDIADAAYIVNKKEGFSTVELRS